MEQFLSKNKSGFSIVEVILTMSIFVLLVTVFVSAYLYGQESFALAGNWVRAVGIARQGMDAVKNMRDESFVNLVDGTYGLGIFGYQWVFSGTEDWTGIFKRQVIISTIDSKRKQVVVRVQWQQSSQRTKTVELTSILTNWRAEDAAYWWWPLPEAGLNIPGRQNALKVQVDDKYAYIVRSGGSPDFVVVDISNSSNPTIVGSLSLPGGPRNIAVEGKYAFVASTRNSQELQIIDVSNPNSPTLIGTYNAPGTSDMLGVDVVGSRVFMVRASDSAQDEFFIIDASDPTNPTLISSLDLGATANEVYVNGGYAYIASDSNSAELQVVDITNIYTPQLVSTLNLWGGYNAETITGFLDKVIVGRLVYGLVHIIDVSDPTAPVEQGVYIAWDDVRDLAMGNNNNYVFLATDHNSAELQVIYIGDPTNPSLVDYYDAPADFNGVAHSPWQERVYGVGDSNSYELIVVFPWL